MRFKRIKSINSSFFSLGGQLSFLLSNLALFYVLIQSFNQESFGVWALYITIVSIADSLRQGIIQNGFTKYFIESVNERPQLFSSAILLNYSVIILISFIIYLFGPGLAAFWKAPELNILFPNFLKSVIALGTIQFLSIIYIAQEKFYNYFIINLLYAVSLIILVCVFSWNNSISLIGIINFQLSAIAIPLIYFIWNTKIKIGIPDMSLIKKLLRFGKHVAGTNLLSLLFNKSDIIIIGFYWGPAPLAIYHFATKIINYADLPLNAYSQVIYPQIIKAYRQFGFGDLKRKYAQNIFRLLLMSITISTMIFLLKGPIIKILSSNEYASAGTIISILLLSSIAKPWGRVFGLTLDAIGKPQINFQMLAFSLIINVAMNIILVPIWGIVGAAIATVISIFLTVIIGQFRINKIIGVSHRNIFQYFNYTTKKKIQSLNLINIKSWI